MKLFRHSYTKLKAYAHQQSATARLGQRAIAGKEEIQSLMDEAVRSVAEAMALKYCKILELLPDGSALLLRAGVGWQEGLVGHAVVESGKHSQAGYTLVSQVPVIASDFGCDTRFEIPPLLAEHGIRGGISVIIKGKQQLFGILGAHTTARGRHFSQDEVNFLQSVANILAHSIERERAEKELQREQAYFRSLIENSSDLITVIDGRAHIWFQSSSAQRLLGYAPHDMINRSALEFLHPEDIPMVLEKIRYATENPAPPTEAYFRMRHKNGAWRIFHGRCSLLPGEPTPPRLVVNSRDVTDSKKLERRVLELLDSAPDAMVVVDPSGTIDLVNSQTERQFGYARQDLIGKPFEYLIPERLRQKHAGLRASYLAQPTSRPMGAGLELYGLHQQGTEFPVEISLSRVGDGAEMEVVAAIRDIGARKEAERELIAHRNAALAGTRAKSEFLHVMSHELRTPLNVLLGMAELLGDTELTAEQREWIGLIDSNGKALLDLINSVLDLAKIESGQLWLENLPFNLNDELEKVISRLRASAHGKGLELAVSVAPGLPSGLVGDPLRLRQILTNLISNAVKFTHQGEIVVNVERPSAQELARAPVASALKGSELARPTTAGDPIVAFHFSVSDTGIGIPADKLGTIFSSFTQGDSSTTRRYGGSGLGLAIVKHLVELLGGNAWVESKLKQGSTFHFTANFTPSTVPVQHPAPEDPDLTGLEVLVVDDTVANRLILKEILTALGARVREVDNGASALEEIRSAARKGNPYQLILLDHHMPEMDGLQVAQALTIEPPALAKDPIILMLSSLDPTPSPDELGKLGINRCLVKPLMRAELIGTIATLIAATAAAQHGDQTPARHLRILLAEDSIDNRFLIKTFLAKTPYILDEASDGQEALDKFTASRYDLILMDREMPVMNGDAATRAIRQWESDHKQGRTPIIALTAAAFAEDVRQSLEAGCDYHLTKPLKKSVLLSTINEVLSKSCTPEAAPS
ncbi:MAG: PAS domain S-box protein [Candidatus Binataceae bacterium]|nr:PAS domain S-box protein [Candidatus Binataceae bacterium]